MSAYLDVEDLDVYQRLCRLHIEVCDLSHDWPPVRSTNWDRRCAGLRIARLLNLRERTTIAYPQQIEE